MDSLKPVFILDVHLGKLAAYLRLLGFDASYSNHYREAEIAEIASTEDRILLTRSAALLKRYRGTPGFKVNSTTPYEQIKEVLDHFHLKGLTEPFSRCMVCNGKLTRVSKENVKALLPPKAILYFYEFYKCQGCERIYWKGSHYGKMLNLVKRLI